MTGIEPAIQAWEASLIPFQHNRKWAVSYDYRGIMQVVHVLILALILFFVGACQTATETEVREPIKLTAESYIRHSVARGETLFSISQRYDVPIRFLILDNDIKDVNDIPIGTILRIRQREGRQTQTAPSMRIPPSEPSLPRETAQRPSSFRKKTLVVKDSPSYVLIPKGGGYGKPVAGRIAQNFESITSSKAPLFGVEINASPSAKVTSVHNGIVVFTANDLAGYGKCILLAHSSGEECFYYGLGDIQVKVGDIVRRSQTLGSLNSKGVLGLKLMRNKIFVDPKAVIPGL